MTPLGVLIAGLEHELETLRIVIQHGLSGSGRDAALAALTRATGMTEQIRESL